MIRCLLRVEDCRTRLDRTYNGVLWFDMIAKNMLAKRISCRNRHITLLVGHEPEALLQVVGASIEAVVRRVIPKAWGMAIWCGPVRFHPTWQETVGMTCFSAVKTRAKATFIIARVLSTATATIEGAIVVTWLKATVIIAWRGGPFIPRGWRHQGILGTRVDLSWPAVEVASHVGRHPAEVHAVSSIYWWIC